MRARPLLFTDDQLVSLIDGKARLRHAHADRSQRGHANNGNDLPGNHRREGRVTFARQLHCCRRKWPVRRGQGAAYCRVGHFPDEITGIGAFAVVGTISLVP